MSKPGSNECKKQKAIKELLQEENCFFKMPIEVAYAILRDLQVQEADIKKIYSRLISPSEMK